MLDSVYRYLKKEAMSLLFLLPALPATAQERAADKEESAGWESYIDEVTAGEDITEGEDAGMHDALSYIAEHPININTATREELGQLPFLSDSQIEDICAYVGRYGPMRTMAETAMIGSLDKARRRLLTSFTYAGEGRGSRQPAVKDMLRHGRHRFTAAAKVPFYERKGDINGYLGYRYKHWIRYDFSYGDRLSFGLVGAQDAGEPFFSGRNRAGYDYYSYYLVLRKMGRLETLALGKYRLAYGMGLVLNTGFSPGKTAALANSGRTASPIRPHSSRSEDGYFNGAAATVRLSRRMKASAFISYRPLDATLNADGTARTIVKTGYHRRPEEMEKKGNTHATAAGGSLRYAGGGLHAGITAVYTHLDRDLRPDTKSLFRRYYAAGNGFMNVGADYGYTSHRLSLSGETAMDGSGAVATANSISLNATDNLRLTALQRFYSYRYTALYASGFSDGGSVNNESGVYLGAAWTPARGLSISAYTDLAYSAWPKYRRSQSSYSADNMLAAAYTAGPWTLAGRYRFRMRQQDNDSKTALTWRNEQRARISAAYDSPTGRWGCRTQADMAVTAQDTRSGGWMAAQRIYYKGAAAGIDMEAAFFDTDDYDSRMYICERSMQYTFAFPSFYGRGFHGSLSARADLGSHLTLRARVAMTSYADRDTIGSGYQTIYGRTMTDLDVQVQIKL